MNKRILAVYYTQSGQTKQILDSFLQPLMADGAEIDLLRIQTRHHFPFPWTIPVFFDTVPESVEVIPTALEPWTTKYDRYDLIVLAWQPWNLSPSIPVSSILQDERFQAIIKDTPLVTICGCRNMWINAMEKNKKLLRQAATRHVGNIALADRHLNHLSYFTIFHWLGTGKKTRKWGIFPLPGVSDEDIAHASVFGQTVCNALKTGDWDALQPALVQQKAVPVKYSLMFIERKAGKIFQKWVNIINKHPQNRKKILVAYKYYLAVALLVASPIILLVDLILVRPFNQKKIKQQMNYYSSVDYNPNI
ncbi:hypothetical protein A8C56_18445 [Niabella ginsenosidivorans]|uniref:Dialkylresorcinol condensing enzyme DarA n=1 Tax=Niabella ginsenosidivorans TaxID=1176587 RepID=A0A1A9I7Q6_9BACT|nr:hypothetical protein [Niabella ginsenosidivorans]ANH82692.1 hypothetical protein A8C56_18445 [Niabella ginsenosidivorans]